MNKEIIITPLGTISPYCKDNKNCPGFLFQYKNYNILLDCGNGISRYLKFPEHLNNINIIISHLHKDHYGDLGSIAYASYVYNKLGYINNKINVYIPEGDKVDVNETKYDNDGWAYSVKVQNNIIDYDYLTNFGHESYLQFIPYKRETMLNYDDLEISFHKNPHSLITYSIKLETEGIKIVYSGDTGYKKNILEKFAKDANLLICESTYLKGQIRNEDNHLFAYEAGMIAKNANVDKLLLTHFWPELDKELYVNEAKKYFNNTEAAIEGKKLILRRKI